MLDKTTRPERPTTTPKTPHWLKPKLFLLLLVLGVVLVMLATLPEDNEGTPGRNVEADEFQTNCGLNNPDCHQGDEYESLDIYTVQDSDDHFLFAAPLEKDGEKLRDEDYEVQAKAVALDGKERYLSYLDSTDNTGQLDLSDYEPEDGEDFWMGFGYRDDTESIFIYIKDPGYEFRDKEHPPEPVAHISVAEDFPDDPEQTITVREGEDGKTLTAAMPRDGSFTLYFDGGDSTDQDGDELTYYWDLNGNGDYETGESGDQLDERGETRQFDYTEAGTYDLKFRVGDGRFETDSLFFTLELEETEKKPELFVDSIAVQDEEGENVEGEIERGELLDIVAYIRNYDEGGYGKATDGNVKVWVYYALDSEDFNDWYLFDGAPVDVGRININKQQRLDLSWDTAETQGEVDESYRIKLVIDQDDEVLEWDEDNNEETHERIIEVIYEPPPEPPKVVIGDIWLSKGLIEENDDVFVNVNLTNEGTGDADYVVLKFYIDGKKKSTSSAFQIPAGQTLALEDTSKGAFPWSPGEGGFYDLKLELFYYFEGEEFTEEQELEDVEVKGYVPPPPPIPNGTGNGSEGKRFFESPAFIGIVAVAGVGAIGALVYVAKRE